jgi:hypothetical protein
MMWARLVIRSSTAAGAANSVMKRRCFSAAERVLSTARPALDARAPSTTV